MTSGVDFGRARREELLADAAIAPLSQGELGELSALLGGQYDPSFEHAAAAMGLALFSVERAEAVPAHLADRLRGDAMRELGVALSTAPRVVPAAQAPAQVIPLRSSVKPPAPRRDMTRWIGWFAAAACFGAAASSWIFRTPKPSPAVVLTAPAPTAAVSSAPVPPSLADQRAQLLATATDVVRVDWTATKDAAAKEVTGDVVWSTAQQKGFMRFHGAQPLDRVASTYQLWIFDEEQDKRFPVDGGVFDVTTGDVIVPITAKIHVGKPTLFAVTIEKPGGVVVSKRERIVVTAAVRAT